MLSRAGARLSSLSGKTYHHSIRCLVISPAINDYSAYHFAPVLPFGFDFVSDELRQVLESRNIDVDSLEKKYNNQIQNDAEFNNPALPSQGSKLWAYIYANRLVKCKVQLRTLDKSEDYLTNYLRAQIEELETRLRRYYPTLDWNGEYNRQLADARSDLNLNLENAKMDAIASVISSSENGDDNYISLFSNNSFIDNYDENDKFNDYLPANLEEKLLKYFEFYFDHSSENSDASKYFKTIQTIEKAVETPVNALSKEIKQNFGLFMLNCFGSNNLDLASSVINVFNDASSLFVSDSEATVSKCLSLLDIKSGKVSKNSADILGSLFFGNSESAKQLNGQDVTAVTPILASAGEERISLIHQALQIESCLKQNSIARILVSLVFSLNREFMAQFVTNSDNIDTFSSNNSSALDNVITAQKAFYTKQEALSQALTKFVNSLVTNVSKDKKVDKDGLTSLIQDTILSSALADASTNVECPIIGGLSEYARECGERGDIVGELKGLTYSKYLEIGGNSVGWYELVNGLLNPPRNGISGLNLSRIADIVANDSSKASEIIFDTVGNYLQQNGLLSDDESQSISNSLSSLVTNDFEALRTASSEFDKARIESNGALQSVSLDLENGFNFEHIADTYDPLNVHLAMYRYLTPN